MPQSRRDSRGKQTGGNFNAPVVIDGSAGTRIADLPDGCVQATVTSPPYYRQKDYHAKDQIGWEATVSEYVESG